MMKQLQKKIGSYSVTITYAFSYFQCFFSLSAYIKARTNKIFEYSDKRNEKNNHLGSNRLSLPSSCTKLEGFEFRYFISVNCKFEDHAV